MRAQGQENLVIAVAGLRADLAEGKGAEDKPKGREDKGGEKEKEKVILDSAEDDHEETTGKEKETLLAEGAQKGRLKKTEHARDWAAHAGVGIYYEVCAQKYFSHTEVKGLFYHVLADCLQYPELWFTPITFAAK